MVKMGFFRQNIFCVGDIKFLFLKNFYMGKFIFIKNEICVVEIKF